MSNDYGKEYLFENIAITEGTEAAARQAMSLARQYVLVTVPSKPFITSETQQYYENMRERMGIIQEDRSLIGFPTRK